LFAAYITFTTPQSQNLTVGQVLPLAWTYAGEPIPEMNLNIHVGGSNTVLFPITSSVLTSARRYDWIIPACVPDGSYWVTALYPGYNIIKAFFPGPPSRTTTFKVNNYNCSTISCPSNLYCDRTYKCSPCADCLKYNDGLGEVCPPTCGINYNAFTLLESRPAGSEQFASQAIKAPILPTCTRYTSLITKNISSSIIFANSSVDSSPQIMTAGLSSALDRLTVSVTSFFGLQYKLVIVAAYAISPPNIEPSFPSLHYEGRAANLTLSPTPTITQLGQLANLATTSGFSWVFFATTTYIHVSVVPDNCQTPLDLVLLLDASGSINSATYGGTSRTFNESLLVFAENLVRSFDIGINKTRVGVVHFSTGAPTPDFLLNQYYDVESIATAIRAIPYDSGGTQTSLGVQAVSSQVFVEVNGMRPQSAGVSRVLIIVTDGQANPGYDPISNTDSLKSTKNVNIFSIGVGCAYDTNQLNGMASAPLSSHVFLLKSFNVINLIVNQVNSATCISATVVTPGQNTTAVADPCDIKYYRPQCGAFTNSIIIQVEDTTGSTVVYVSTITETPGPYNYSIISSTTPYKTIVVTQTESILPVFIGVQGVAPANSFVINVYSGMRLFSHF
jgi:hypothetical protein